MKREYLLPRANQMAVIEMLTPADLADVLTLQDETRAALPEANKMFILPQKPDYFEKFLTRTSGFMIGIRTGGKLVAQMAAMGPLTLEEAIERNAITRNEVPFHHAEPTDLVMIAKSMAVHPDWRGNELSQHMLGAIIDSPQVRQADHLFAQMSADNVRSWDLFLEFGFNIVAAAIDPIDNQPRFILQRPALGFDFYESASVERLNPVADFQSIMRMTTYEALIGRLDDGQSKGRGTPKTLSFYASGETAAAWSEEPAKLA